MEGDGGVGRLKEKKTLVDGNLDATGSPFKQRSMFFNYETFLFGA